jgi:hypothetical protein
MNNSQLCVVQETASSSSKYFHFNRNQRGGVTASIKAPNFSDHSKGRFEQYDSYKSYNDNEYSFFETQFISSNREKFLSIEIYDRFQSLFPQ